MPAATPETCFRVRMMNGNSPQGQNGPTPKARYSILEKEADLRVYEAGDGGTDYAGGKAEARATGPEQSEQSPQSAEEYGSHGAARLPMAPPRARKRVFIGLICGTTLMLCLLLALGWVIPNIGLSNIHPSLPYISGAILGLLCLLAGWLAVSLVLQVLIGVPAPKSSKTWGLTVKLFVPLLELVGRLVGVTPMDVRHSFIQVNNSLVHAEKRRFKPEEILLLLPHCLQWSECGIRVSNNLDLCRRCGKCDLAALLDLTNRYGTHIAVATGGTIARRIVVEKRPRLIIAIACERDLTSGIQDTYPLPVYGILNERPFGPCVNTRVPLERVEEILKHFIRCEI